MTKKQIMFQITLASLLGASALSDYLRYKSKGWDAEHQSGAAGAYNLCAGNLAKDIGIASLIWDKPAALAKAA